MSSSPIPSELVAQPTESDPPIVLHELCNTCTQFFGQWPVLDWFQQADSTPAPAPKVYELSSAMHVVQNQSLCHFCRFLFSALDNRYMEQTHSRKIYLNPQVKKDNEDQEVFIRFEHEKPPPATRADGPFEKIYLKTYQTEDTDGFHAHIIAKSVPAFARDNLERAKGWLRTCLLKHTKCEEFHRETIRQDNRRPTRLLQIVNSSSVRLRCNMSNEGIDYLVLSHIWGDPSLEHIKLLASNITNFQEDIPWDQLSDIYKEAVRVTLALGYRYLWIDSLCIMQNSSSDWDFEARLMATVYGNAICNLSFLFPSLDSNPNISNPRSDPRDWNPCIMREASSSRPGVYMQMDTNFLRYNFHSSGKAPWLAHRQWPLFSRSWTFQEYLLSPRTLLLGHYHLMWQCNAGFYDELIGLVAEPPTEYNDVTPKQGRDMGKSRYFPEYLRGGLDPHLVMSAPKNLYVMTDWQMLMEDYRNRYLTEAKDRVIALAGVARAFANFGAMTYLAGIWKELFPLCILWYVGKKSSLAVRVTEPNVPDGHIKSYPRQVREDVIHDAPSWSQFSVPIFIYHQTHFLFKEDLILVRCQSYQDPPGVYFHDIYWVDLESFQFENHEKNIFLESGYYDFAGLSLTLEMYLLPCSNTWSAELVKQIELIRESDPLFDNLLWEPDYEYYSDIPSLMGDTKSPPKNGVMALVCEFQVCRDRGSWPVQRRFGGLMLLPVDKEANPQRWRRVGAWSLKVRIAQVGTTHHNVSEEANGWAKRSLWTPGELWMLKKVTLV